MENQDLNLWLLKKMQTESELRLQEQKLQISKNEYNTEKTKYNQVKENFHDTKKRLLCCGKPSADPRLLLAQKQEESRKLAANKCILETLNAKVKSLEEKLSRHAVLVLQNKKKMELLEGKVVQIHARKAAKKNFAEELEALDRKIHEFAKNRPSLKELDKEEAAETSLGAPEPHETYQASSSNPERPLDGRHEPEKRGQQYLPESHPAPAPGRQTEFIEHAEKLQELITLSNGADDISLCYQTSGGQEYEIQLRRRAVGMEVEISAASAKDLLPISSSRAEIKEELRARGIAVNAISFRSIKHVSA